MFILPMIWAVCDSNACDMFSSCDWTVFCLYVYDSHLWRLLFYVIQV